MSNFAALIDVLTIAGSRLSDGEPNSSGTVYFFQPGGNTPVNVYSDAAATTIVTQPLVLTSGGLVNIATVPNGLYVTQPVRVLIQDVNTNTVADTVYVPATAGDVGVSNAGFTDDNLDDVLTKAFTSFGGQDWKYKESGGATSRTVKAKFAEGGISVKDFGAVGNGVAIDTTAVQAAMSRAKVLSCACLFPAGTYKIDQALTLSSATGVSLRGVGSYASKIITSHASANVFTLTSCTGFEITGLGISATATNSGSAISLSSCTAVIMTDVRVDTTAGGTFLIPVVSTTTSTLRLEACSLTAKAADATARALKLTGNSGVYVSGGFFSGLAGAAMEFAGSTSFVQIFGAGFGNVSANIGILWTAAMTGTDFTVVGCPTLRSAAGTFTTPFDLSALSTNPRFRQWGNEVDGYTLDVASAGTATPDLSRGRDIRIRATSTGAAITIALPTPAPSAVMHGYTILLDIFNNAGGALSNAYTVNAGYHLTTVPNQTDLNHNQYLLRWDANSSVWRQVSLSVTT